MRLPPFLHKDFVCDDGRERWDVSRLAREAARFGVRPGARVVAAPRPSLAFAAQLCAWVAAGAEVLLLAPDLPAAAGEDLARRFGALSPCRPPLGDPIPREGIEQAYVAVLATSGTTGVPKLVPLHFRQFYVHAQAAAQHLGLSAADRWLASLPVHHVGGLSVFMRAMLLGSTVHVRAGFDVDETNRLLDAGAVSHASLVPTTFKRLLDARRDKPFAPSVDLLLVGGAALPQPLRERARRMGAPVAPTYGLTEACSQATTVRPSEFLAGDDSAGTALPGVEVTVRDATGVVLSENREGEIYVAGETVKAAYLGEPPAGRVHPTGDVGVLRGGRLYVLDRRSDLIVSGGENVYPAQVEDVVRAFPGVRDCGVVGVPDDEWGARVVAVIEGAFDEAALRQHCRVHLPRHAVPKAFVSAAALPRTAGGKLRRAALRETMVATGRG